MSVIRQVDKIDFAYFGKLVRNARVKNNMTQQELANELKISTRHINNIENKGEKISLDLFLKIAMYFDISIDHLLHKNCDISSAEKLKLIIESLSNEDNQVLLAAAERLYKLSKQ